MPLTKQISLIFFICIAAGQLAISQETSLTQEIDRLSSDISNQVVEWRRHFHEHPELSNREFKTAARVAEHLKSLGMEVQTQVAHTGVVGVLRGTSEHPCVALRADMDALPIVERVDVPFASKVRTKYAGQDVGVMHACGHDAHTAMLMGVASVLVKLKDQIPGTVKFIFQPAEEGPPKGEDGGARMMVEEGVLRSPKVKAIFGLHVSPYKQVGEIAYRHGGMLASADVMEIVVKGKQTHGAIPWNGQDPIVSAAHIITGLQTVVSRRTDLTKAAAVVTIGSIKGGERFNIIPDEVRMTGTVRALDPKMDEEIHEHIVKVVKNIAESMDTTAIVEFYDAVPVTYNDQALTKSMLPTLQAVAGSKNVVEISPQTSAEDFSFFQEKVPGFYFYLGVRSKSVPLEQATAPHTPDFTLDESGLELGIRAMATLAVDYISQNQ